MTDQQDAPVAEKTAPIAADAENGDTENADTKGIASEAQDESAAASTGSAVAESTAPASEPEEANEPEQPEEPDLLAEAAQAESGSGSSEAETEAAETPAPEMAVEAPATEQEKVAEPAKTPPPPPPERPEVTALREAMAAKAEIEGKIIGWNNGGLHVVVNGITAFCPRSEIAIGAPKGLDSYLDQTLTFNVLRVQKRGRRVVLSRRAILQGDRDEKITGLRKAMQNGDILEGKVSSITDFGAFVDLGGIDGLVHVSELSRTRIEHPSELVTEGDSVKVRVLKIGDDGKRVSLSMKALEPDPWDGLEDVCPAGSIVKGTVERIAKFGAFIEIAPGVTGLLPASAMNLPRNANPARIYNPGKEVAVQVLSIDRRRRRISLSLEGSQVEATRADLKSYLAEQGSGGTSFGALAAAFDKARQKKDG